MQVSVGRWRGVALGQVLLVILLSGSGCQTATTSLFTVSGRGWRVQQGQALWRPGRGFPELGGDLVLASHEDGRCLVEFAKTPMSLLAAQITGTDWLIQFPVAHRRLGGRWPPPTRFAWLYLHGALTGQRLPAALRFERKPDGGWRLENVRSGETVEGILTL